MVLRLSTNFCVAVILESGTKFISQVLFKLKAQSMYTMLVLCWHLLKIFRKWHIPKFSPIHSFGCLKKQLWISDGLVGCLLFFGCCLLVFQLFLIVFNRKVVNERSRVSRETWSRNLLRLLVAHELEGVDLLEFWDDELSPHV